MVQPSLTRHDHINIYGNLYSAGRPRFCSWQVMPPFNNDNTFSTIQEVNDKCSSNIAEVKDAFKGNRSCRKTLGLSQDACYIKPGVESDTLNAFVFGDLHRWIPSHLNGFYGSEMAGTAPYRGRLGNEHF
jgi:hypothetical protein